MEVNTIIRFIRIKRKRELGIDGINRNIILEI